MKELFDLLMDKNEWKKMDGGYFVEFGYHRAEMVVKNRQLTLSLLPSDDQESVDAAITYLKSSKTKERRHTRRLDSGTNFV